VAVAVAVAAVYHYRVVEAEAGGSWSHSRAIERSHMDIVSF